MQPRIDANLGIQGEPDVWVHSACILCSNGCGLDIAVKDARLAELNGEITEPFAARTFETRSIPQQAGDLH